MYNVSMDTWGTVIVTDNALRKMAQYGLHRDGVMDAFNHSDREENSPIANCKSYIKNYKDYEIGVIANRKTDGTWIIVSCWNRRLFP